MTISPAVETPVQPLRPAVQGMLFPAVLAPGLAYAAPLGMWIPVVLALFLMGWDCWRFLPARQAVRGFSRGLLSKALLALPLLGVMLAPWSLLPLFSAQRSIAVFAQLVALLLLMAWGRSWPQRWRWGVVGTLGISALLWGLFFEIDRSLGSAVAVFLHGESFSTIQGATLSRGASFHAFTVLPGCLALWALWPNWRGACAALGLAALSLPLLFIGTNNTAFMALAVGGAVLAVMLALPKLRWAVPVLAAGAIAAMPLAISPLKEVGYCTLILKAPSLAHRLEIWSAVSSLVAAHPFIGWGVDTARVAPGGKEMMQLRSCGPDGQATGPVQVVGETIPLHPHNGALDLWFSLGALGALSAAGLIAGILGASLRRLGAGRLGGAGVAAFACQVGLTTLVSYGLWQTWFVSVLSLGIWAISLVTESETSH